MAHLAAALSRSADDARRCVIAPADMIAALGVLMPDRDPADIERELRAAISKMADQFAEDMRAAGFDEAMGVDFGTR